MNFYFTIIATFLFSLLLASFSTSDLLFKFFFTQDEYNKVIPNDFFANTDFYIGKIKDFILSADKFFEYLIYLIKCLVIYYDLIFQITYIIFICVAILWIFIKKSNKKMDLYVSNIEPMTSVNTTTDNKMGGLVQKMFKQIVYQLGMLFSFHIFSKLVIGIMFSGLIVKNGIDTAFLSRFYNFVDFCITTSSYSSVIFVILSMMIKVNNHVSSFNDSEKGIAYTQYNKYIVGITKYWFIGSVFYSMYVKNFIPVDVLNFIVAGMMIMIIINAYSCIRYMYTLFDYMPKIFIHFLSIFAQITLVISVITIQYKTFFDWYVFINYVKYLYIFILLKIFIKGFIRKVDNFVKLHELEKFYFISLYIICLYFLCNTLLVDLGVNYPVVNKVIKLIFILNCIYFFAISSINILNKHLEEKYPIYDKKQNKKLIVSMKVHTIGNFITVMIKTLSMITSVLIGMVIFNIDTGAALSGLGVVFLGISLAMQDFIKDLIYGLMVVIDQTIVIGDCIKINDKKGLVEKITLKGVIMRDIISNSLLSIRFSTISSIENFNRGLISHILIVNVNKSVNMVDISDILNNVIQKLAESEAHKDKISPIVGSKGIVDSSSENKTIRYDIKVLQSNIYNAMHDISVNFDNVMKEKGISYSAYFSEYTPTIVKMAD